MKKQILLGLITLLSSSFATDLCANGLRVNAGVYDDGYYDGYDWDGPGWYSGIYFDDEDRYYSWRRGYPYYRSYYRGYYRGGYRDGRDYRYYRGRRYRH